MKKMKSGINYEQGEILLVPFPFTNLKSIKQRPVLVLSSTGYNNKTEDVITCGITSNLKDTDHSVLIESEQCISGTIPTTSRIKVDKLFTLEQSIILKRWAKVNKETFEQVKREFFQLIG